MIVIVDYGMGNLRSVEKAGLFLGKALRVTSSRRVIEKAKKIIFPGVGHFGEAVKELKARNIFDVLIKQIKRGIPFLGICLGMQLLLEESEEAPSVKGLAVLRGKVKRFKKQGLIVPQMGWNNVKIKPACRQAGTKKENIFKGIKDESMFYFAQSYYCEPKDKKVVAATTYYGIEYASSLHKDNVWAVQFHPEKSQSLGLKIFNNFLKL
ncbi:MAG: imidazole glycerol phosphate synthase subunit HisH [Candidatus Omnitrophota bacterium]|nr:MAG: imidazole glycerol phosphate synthase subunit HisH [Candidatus Omnitrophota bacterium]